MYDVFVMRTDRVYIMVDILPTVQLPVHSCDCFDFFALYKIRLKASTVTLIIRLLNSCAHTACRRKILNSVMLPNERTA